MKKKRLIKISCCIIGVILIWNHLPYYYNNDKVATYVTYNAEPKSRTMCAGYVIEAMWHGGCPDAQGPDPFVSGRWVLRDWNGITHCPIIQNTFCRRIITK